jgi:hypothetical protein
MSFPRRFPDISCRLTFSDIAPASLSCALCKASKTRHFLLKAAPSPAAVALALGAAEKAEKSHPPPPPPPPLPPLGALADTDNNSFARSEKEV